MAFPVHKKYFPRFCFCRKAELCTVRGYETWSDRSSDANNIPETCLLACLVLVCLVLPFADFFFFWVLFCTRYNFRLAGWLASPFGVGDDERRFATILILKRMARYGCVKGARRAYHCCVEAEPRAVAHCYITCAWVVMERWPDLATVTVEGDSSVVQDYLLG